MAEIANKNILTYNDLTYIKWKQKETQASYLPPWHKQERSIKNASHKGHFHGLKITIQG